jgi:uncharacterized protein YecT (DUF1311 family)
MFRYMFLVFIGSFSLCYAGDLTLLGGEEDSDTVQVEMRNAHEACSLWVDSTGSIDKGSCRRMINSKHTVIYCTRNKKLCKTQQEIRDFVMQPPASNIPNEHGNTLGYSADYQFCIDNSGGVTSRLIVCNRNELAFQDARLNQNYAKAMHIFDAKHRQKLKHVQRIWIQYRDAKCDFVSDLTGGTIDAIVTGGCYVDTTARRAKELEELLVD